MSTASRYYSTLPYFISKFICDLLPIRVLPAVLYCFITYGMIGLRGQVGSDHFWQYLVLVLLVNAVVRCVKCGMMARISDMSILHACSWG